MNSHVHTGQTSGQVLNQTNNMLSGLPQQNGVPLSTQIRNLGGRQNIQNMDLELVKERRFMQQKIYELLTWRRQQQQQGNEIPQKRVLDLVRRLEEGLFRTAATKEEYMNLETLGNRLNVFTKHLPLNNHGQQFPHHVNSSSSISTMIPTPCMPQNGNSSLIVTSSVDTSIITASGCSSNTSIPVNTGNFLAAADCTSGNMQGPLPNGYQYPPSNFSMSTIGNNTVSSMGVQRMMSQMIPTPGFNTMDNPSHRNLESSNNDSGFSIVESTRLSQPLQQKQHVGGQNSRILHNLGSHMAGAIRSGLQQKSYGSSNGALNGGLRRIGSDLQLLNGPGISEGYRSTKPYGNLPKLLPQHYDQHQRPIMQGDVYGMSPTGSSGSGSLYVPVTSAGLMINNQNLNPVSLPCISDTGSPSMANQWHTTPQAADIKLQLIDLSEKFDIQSSHSMRENLVQSHLKQPQEQPCPFQQEQHQQEQQIQQHQLLLRNDAFGQSQLTYNAGSQINPGPAMDLHNEFQLQLSEMQNQFQQNPVEDQSRDSQLLSPPSGPQSFCASVTRTSQQMQPVLHPHQFVADSQNDFSCLSVGVQSEAVLQGHCNHKSQNGSHIPGNLPNEQNVQDEFSHRMTIQDEAHRSNLSSEAFIICQTIATKTTQPPNSSGAMCGSGNLDRKQEFRNQQRWLLFLRHARRCPAPEGKCLDANCINAQKLLRHMERCNVAQCPYPRCRHTKILINHHRNCMEPGCPVCIPVKNYVQIQLKAYARSDSNSQIIGPCKSYDITDTTGLLASNTNLSVVETSEDLQFSLKRMKIEQASHSLAHESENSVLPVPADQPSFVQAVKCDELQHCDPCISMKLEPNEVKMEIPPSSGQGSPSIIEIKDNMDDTYMQRPEDNPAGFTKQESLKIEKEVDQSKQENVMLATANAGGTKSGKPKVKGVSLIELFTPEQVREHIISLRRWVGQSKAKAEKNQAMGHSVNENSCQLCAVEKLNFDPPPMYCTPCGARIIRNAMYYTIGAGDTRHYFCIPCYNKARGDTIIVDGTNIPKVRLEKKRNDEEIEEWWVQCDKCEAWQHQICALFNGRRNDGGQAEYTCPNCCIAEIERGDRKPLPQSAVLGAKDLPRTILSDHIEQRLFRRLEQERQERAGLQGNSHDEVPGAEALVIRVVSSVDKKLEVKQRFLELFQVNYPTEFMYKSKVILLFQKIEGVEVCLFGMYVQEFGSECQQPNHRRVYLSYLDSVKYFKPEIKAVMGEALRTFVYHEILIAYLEYCKKRGYTSCYIWACPPLKGEDYILYCHPEIQKTPKSDKLREWYLSMLRKAAKENVVVGLTNLYDHFFVSNGECKAKVTAARLPYFDGDYWPGAAEDIIYQIHQEEDGRKQYKKGITRKMITKRALKASGQADLSVYESKDLLLMRKLGETISPMKEDFIMVHLQHACSHCCILMVSGNRWVCSHCNNFQLCDKCYEAEQKLEERERHPIYHRDKHVFCPVEINDVPADTKDKDEILESEFFDTRQAFLSLCQGNHYQYDTLRRAKHSSMMVLYHLHNPTAPAFVTTCNICNLDIEAGQGWRCEICPDYDVCNACYQKDSGIDHPHKLTNHLSMADRDAQNKEARQLRVSQLRKMLDLLVHASQCRSPHCQYPNCRKVKGLFRHGIQCKTRASGGCIVCNRMWYLLKLHARACRESECHVPRCRDLKEHLKRFQQQSDSRRRAAVMEMMRQRAAEVADNAE